MDLSTTIAAPSRAHDGQKAALISLLADEDATVYQAVRGKFLSLGVVTRDWLHPHALSSDPCCAVVRRKSSVTLIVRPPTTVSSRFA
jgi:hypothetical protein